MQGFTLVFGTALLGLHYSGRIAEIPWGAAWLQLLIYSSGVFFGISIVHDIATHFAYGPGTPLLRYWAWSGFLFAAVGGKMARATIYRIWPPGNSRKTTAD